MAEVYFALHPRLPRHDALKVFSEATNSYIPYRGCEHAFVGETQSGKTWLALACVAAELCVVYVRYEESTPASTIEGLHMLGVTDALMTPRSFRFVAPH
jgi:hypothetical protein